MNNSLSWDEFFIGLVFFISMKSKDRSTKVGAVIVKNSDNTIVSLGYNGFPRGVDDETDARHERPTKYFFAEHAERNAIYNTSENLENCRIYVNLLPCADCARGIIQKGIKEIIVHKGFTEAVNSGTYDESHKASMEMFKEAGVKVRWYEGHVPTSIYGVRHGTKFNF